MPLKLTMSGGAPWGFRLAGGGSSNLTVSRVTPGGKANLDGIVEGDRVLAINGQHVDGIQLGELMTIIKNTGNMLALTIVKADEEIQTISNQTVVEEPIIEQSVNPKIEIIVEETEADKQLEVTTDKIIVDPENTEQLIELVQQKVDGDSMTKKEWYSLPKYIREKIRPPKPLPNFKPQVNWMRGKLRLDQDHSKDNACNVAGQQLRNAVLAQKGPIELNAGPINGKILHSQYNSPLNCYSDPQIVSSLVCQAVASGADIQDPSFFTHGGVKVDKDSSTYKEVNSGKHSYNRSKQSKSFNILTTLMKHPYMMDE